MREEYEMIYKKYYKQVYLFLYKLCGNSDLSEELTQETFYQTYLSLHRFKDGSDIFTFIAAIGKHTYFKHLRKNKNVVCEISLSEFSELFKIVGNEGNPEYIYERTALSERLREIIDSLPKKYKDVIIYRVYADMTFAQIAADLKITENSAKVIFFRAKKMLLEELKNGDYV